MKRGGYLKSMGHQGHRSLMVIALGMTAVPGHAATREMVSDQPSSDEMKLMFAFGKCVAMRPFSSSILSVLPYSLEESRIVSKVATGDCIPAKARSNSDIFLRFRAYMLRGRVAESLYQTSFLGGGVRPRRKGYAIFAQPSPEALGSAQPEQRSAIAMISFAECVAARDRAGVEAVMATDIASAEERGALTMLQPTLGKCLEGQGSIKLNRYLLRGYLAEGAYRQAIKATGNANA